MGWIYNTNELITKEDYIDALNEILAYRALDGEDFDFGNGLITNEMSLGSEDAYYEMDIWTLESLLECWDCSYCRARNVEDKKKKHKHKPNRHKLNSKHKNKTIKNSKRNDYYPVYWKASGVIDKYGDYDETNSKGHYKRYYRGSRSKFLKKLSNKKIRNYRGYVENKGNKHKRLYDFWWELN